MVGGKATAKPEACCGCGACAKACPKQCIRMVADGEGFVFPQVDADTCVNCGSFTCLLDCVFNFAL